MKYRVKVRKYETVIRDVVIEVEASGRRLAEANAIDQAKVLPNDQWGAPSEGHDLKLKAEAEKVVEVQPRVVRLTKPMTNFVREVAAIMKSANVGNIVNHRDKALSVMTPLFGTTLLIAVVFEFSGRVEGDRYVCTGYRHTVAKQTWFVSVPETFTPDMVAARLLSHLEQ